MWFGNSHMSLLTELQPRLYPTSGRPRRENIGGRPNDPSIENRYALRCKMLPRADAELDSRVQEPFKVAHSTSGKVVQNHDCPGVVHGIAQARDRPIHPHGSLSRRLAATISKPFQDMRE